jgi:hypothetical protein
LNLIRVGSVVTPVDIRIPELSNRRCWGGIFCTRDGRAVSRWRARRVPIELSVIPPAPLHATHVSGFLTTLECEVLVSGCWYLASFL